MITNACSPNINNALNWYSWAKALNLETLLHQCAQTVAWNAQEVMVSQNWLNMDSDFLYDVLSSNELVILSEFYVYSALKTWLLHEPNLKSEQFEDNMARLLPLIRLPQMFVFELYKLESDTELPRSARIQELLDSLLSKAYRFRALCERQKQLGITFANNEFYMPRDYLHLVVDNVRLQNNLRFGLQVRYELKNKKYIFTSSRCRSSGRRTLS